MTFYWWSHWFWITLLSLIVFHPASVLTYPSQESEGPRLGEQHPQASITKLYQASTTIFARPTERSHHSHEHKDEQTPQAAEEEDTEYPLVDANGEAEAGVVEMERPLEDNAEDEESGELRDFEFKRSAESLNQTAAKAEKKAEEQLPAQPTEMSNYTNFSRTAGSSNASQVAAETLKTPPANSSLADAGLVAGRENGSTTLAWLNAVATVTVNDDEEEKEPHKAPFTLENVHKEEELRRAENEHRTRKSKGLSAEYKHANRFGDSKNLLTRSAATATATSPNEYDNDGGNISSEALAIQRTYFLDAGAISAICFTVFGFCCTVGTIGIVLYRRRFLNKPQALSEPDSSVYIDDSTMRVSDNSDEMYSLDNDSFLNSLEAMTIQNYWTDTVKHTKL